MFLTYPQYMSKDDVGGPVLDVVKTTLLAQLSGYVRDGRILEFDRGVVAKEQHEDGNWHLHAYLHAKLREGGTQVRIKHSDLDLAGKHGNYQSVRSDEAVVKYCKKDGDFIFWGPDPRDRAELRGKKRNLLLAGLVKGDITLEQAVEEDTNLLRHYKNLGENLRLFQANKKKRPDGVAPRFVYLTGPSGVGKTTLAKSLKAGGDTFLVPLSSTGHQWWFDGYQGQRCLVFDNVSKATCPPYDLICQMADRSACSVPVKGGFVTCSPDVIVITSTLAPNLLWTEWDLQMKRRITDLWEASLTTDTTTRNQDEIMELSTGVNRPNLIWKKTDLTKWCITALPPATLSLLEVLQNPASIVTSLQSKTTIPTATDVAMDSREAVLPLPSVRGTLTMKLPSTKMTSEEEETYNHWLFEQAEHVQFALMEDD